MRQLKGGGELANGTLWTGTGIVASTFSTFAAGLLMVAVTTPANYADVVVLTLIVAVIGNLVRFGADRIVVSEVRAAAGKGSDAAWSKAADLVAFSIGTGLIGSVLVCLPFSRSTLDYSLSSGLSGIEVGAVALWLASDVVRLVVAETYRADLKFGPAAFASYGIRAPLFLLLLGVEGILGGGLDRTTILLDASGASAVVCVVATAMLPRNVRWWRAHPLLSGRTLWRGHLTMVLTTFAATLIGGADVWIVGSVADDATTASYALAVTLVSGIAMLGAAITGGASPYLASAIARSNYESIQSRLIRAIRLAAILGVLAYVGLLAVVSPLAVQLGGSAYEDVSVFVAVLGAGQIVNLLAGIPGAVLVAARRYEVLMAIAVTVAVAVVAIEVVAGFVLHNVVLIAVSSSAATGALPLVACVVASQAVRVRTDVFARR
ncbi:O-antigen/teichoic acid export membrane protein [Marmoricola sp. URHA0025 HA25]